MEEQAMVRVVNRHAYTGTGTYVGRPGVFGNPYVIGKHGDRAQVIEKYREWLRREWKNGCEVKQELLKLVAQAKSGDLTLICSCKPLGCHGDVLKDVIETLVAKGY